MSDPLEVFPAIDLRGGRVVRLAQGDPSRETRYGCPLYPSPSPRDRQQTRMPSSA